jgi:hypothetical protein
MGIFFGWSVYETVEYKVKQCPRKKSAVADGARKKTVIVILCRKTRE